MDSFTQATLGAAVADALLARKVGNKATLWGAIAGTLPDLDIVAYPLMDQIEQIGWHRGPSHAIFYLTLAAPMAGWLISRIHKNCAKWKQWSLVIYLCFITHIALDVFTVYGTQIFRPFSRLPVAFDSISIIDPLYTIPILAAVLIALFLQRHSSLRRKVVIGGLVLSTLYLAFTVVTKAHVGNVATSELRRQDIVAERFITTPTIFNSLLWRITAESESDGGFFIGYYSLMDSDDTIEFAFIPQDDRLLDRLSNTTAIEKLQWFSRGFYVVEDHNGKLVLSDIRFGTIDAGNPDSRRFIFRWEASNDPDNPKRGHIERLDIHSVDFSSAISRLWQRIWGK